MKSTPTILVVFGATGDLAQKKIIPALWHLHAEAKLPPSFSVIGFSRRDLDRDGFVAHVAGALSQYRGKDLEEHERSFLDIFGFVRGYFDASDAYDTLKRTIEEKERAAGGRANKLFYLAVTPEMYETVLTRVAESRLGGAAGDAGVPEWTRIIVEKPFGKNADTAQALDTLLGTLFREEQIYRIDHYLAKEMIQNILAFRFSNNLFENNWNAAAIERIDIRLWEDVGVEERGSFYDGVGALRDVGQNHLLQMLALITMERPASFDAPALRRARADILRTLVRPSERDVMATSVRAQYDGYRAIRGAGPDSNTETYFKVRAALSSPRWRGTDITLESGKRMGERKKEIVITFKHPAPCMCPAGGEHLRNKIVIALEPEERITIHFWSKKPGFAYDLEERMLTFMLRGETHRSQYVEEYKKLLLDCITGDQTLFVSTDEVYHMWRFTDGITDAWENNAVPLGRYTPDTSCIAESGVPPQGTTAPEAKDPAREIGFVGLGKMGRNMAEHLAEQGWRVAAYDRSAAATAAAAERGITAAGNMRGLVSHLSAPRLVWLMIPAGRAVDEALFGAGGLASLLSRGDTVIDGGNSFYGDTMKRAKKLAARGIRFLDVGVSGGPEGARHGAALMIGGDGEDFARWEHLFRDLAGGRDYVHTGKSGAGHFAKMVHNGIEYGMMQSLAEGFAILKKAPFGFDLKKIAEAYNNGSVIESRLVGWLARAYEAHGEDLKGITGAVGHSGEGEWTAQTAKKLRVPAPVIADAFDFRVRSKKKPSYTGRILSALRNQFGGHSVQ